MCMGDDSFLPKYHGYSYDSLQVCPIGVVVIVWLLQSMQNPCNTVSDLRAQYLPYMRH